MKKFFNQVNIYTLFALLCFISKGDVVVYESTVYPGVTEDECIPVVEKVSGMKMNVDFFAGYSLNVSIQETSSIQSSISRK